MKKGLTLYRSKTQFSQVLFMLILVTVDIVSLFGILLLAGMIIEIFFFDITTFSSQTLPNYFWIVLIVLFLLFYEKIYMNRFDFWEEMYKIFKALMYSFVGITVFLFLSNYGDEYSRFFIPLFFTVAAILMPIIKRVVKRILFQIKFFKLRLKVIAEKNMCVSIGNEMQKNWYLGYEIVNKRYDVLLISSRKYSIEKLPKVIEKYSRFTKDIYIIPYVDNIDFSTSEMVSYSNLNLAAFHVENRLLNYKNIVLKFIVERILVLLVLPIFLVLHVFISFAIKFDSCGKVIFKQKRFGKGSKLYSCYKYRTMYEDSDYLLKQYLKKCPQEVDNYAVFHKYKNDPRITKVGKFLRESSLDELHQFINILKGEMNLIGPRPYMYEESKKIPDSSKEIIFKVRPGITGLWQVRGRSELSFEERIKLDVWYINNWSLWLDFVIFLKTIKVVFSKLGAR